MRHWVRLHWRMTILSMVMLAVLCVAVLLVRHGVLYRVLRPIAEWILWQVTPPGFQKWG